MDLRISRLRSFVTVASACALAPCLSAAAPPRIVVSLSDPATLPSGVVDDEELVMVGNGPLTRFLSDSSLSLYFGDRNHDGLYDEPNDIDAIAFRPHQSQQSPIAETCFSLLSDQNGIKDGDVLRFDPTDLVDGLEVVFAEGDLITLLGVNDGNLDVDALAFGADGTTYISLAEDEVLGAQQIVAQDETVFAISPDHASASVYFTASQMENFAKTALGITAAVGDVMALEVEGDHLLFTVQSPSAHDGTILSTANGGQIWNGATEGSFGIGVDVEFDALALYDGPTFGSLDCDPSSATLDTAISVRAEGMTPNAPCLLVLSGQAITAGTGSFVPGFGVLVPSPFDPIFVAAMTHAPALLTFTGADGVAVVTGSAPAAGPTGIDMAIQAYDGTGQRFSSPVVLELLP